MDAILAQLLQGVIVIPIVLGSLVLHEIGHGYAALRLGDPTAKRLGRLSLNPIKHLDPVGLGVFLLCFFLVHVGFGWAKPVPIDPRNLSDPKRDMARIAIAGPLVNFGLLAGALTYLLLLQYVGGIAVWPEVEAILQAESLASVQGAPALLVLAGMVGLMVNLVLGFGNLIPIPPLDGSRILYAFLPYYWGYRYYALQRFTIPGLFLLPAGLILYNLYRIFTHGWSI